MYARCIENTRDFCHARSTADQPHANRRYRHLDIDYVTGILIHGLGEFKSFVEASNGFGLIFSANEDRY